MVLKVNPESGSYSDVHMENLPVNSINWEASAPEQPPIKGHFLCFDRWRPPTEAEKANGFKHHGEVNTQKWKICKKPQSINNITICTISCQLPMGSLKITRKVELRQGEPMFFVSEEIKDLNQYGRIYNIVQQVTLAPPFLDLSNLFDNNTEKRFEDKEDGNPDQEEPVLKWPEVLFNEKKISLRKFQNEWPGVSTFVFPENEKYGWGTAANPNQNLLLDYIWKTQDYPWINFWRHMEERIPVAFGMEFGATGLHEPFPVMAKKGKNFNRNIYEFIDAGFFAKILDDYQGVEKIEVDKSDFTLRKKEKNQGILLIN